MVHMVRKATRNISSLTSTLVLTLGEILGDTNQREASEPGVLLGILGSNVATAQWAPNRPPRPFLPTTAIGPPAHGRLSPLLLVLPRMLHALQGCESHSPGEYIFLPT